MLPYSPGLPRAPLSHLSGVGGFKVQGVCVCLEKENRELNLK